MPAAAESDFISLYLAAQGGCANTAISPLSFVLSGPDQQAPFGKPAEKWTGEDLAALKMALAACQAAAAQAGNPYTSQEVRQESEDVLTRVPQIVARAKAQAEARLQQIEARRQIANARIDRAVQAKQQAKASAETEATRLEREADAVEAEARDAQQRLDQRILRATHTRNEANARSA